MFRFRRNKSELIVLTGAIYSFVAYLTAFTLEVLFIIDLTRRSNEILAASTQNSHQHPDGQLEDRTQPHPNSNGPSSQPPFANIDDDLFLRNTGLDRLKFESIQAHITISCLAISILYFVTFIISLTLIVALIMRSTFMLLIWICAMITIYLPEFCLVAYVSIFCWGSNTRNGQTELIFYLFRAVLNAMFIFRAHKLFRQLNYEKNFFRLKSGGRTSASSHFAGYDSPYFINDSLTNTTINPVFNSSTLNLNRYDYIRNHQQLNYNSQSSRGHSPPMDASEFHEPGQTGPMTISAYNTATGGIRAMRSRLNQGHICTTNEPLARRHGAKFYLDQMSQRDLHQRPASQLSINDDLVECELDLDYRTLNRSSRQHVTQNDHRHSRHVSDRNEDGQSRSRHTSARNQDLLPSYSTQSLDRRNIREYALNDHVVLRPLGHQPFEYLFRPGSTSNLNSMNANSGADRHQGRDQSH